MDTEFSTEVKPKTLYVVEFEWDDDREKDNGLEVSEQIEKLKVPDGVDSTDRHAGACWGYWRRIEGENWQAVKEYSEKVLRLLKRRGCRVEMY
jgi:hypothetical protein